MHPNKDYWTGREVTEYERKQRLLVPRKDEMLEVIVDLVPFGEEDAFTVVDVGAGQGALSERILGRFPGAHMVLVDASAEMLDVAEGRLARYAPRFSIVRGDFNEARWHAMASRRAPSAHPVGAVVSSIALHYLKTERRAPFFREVYDLLDTRGFFAHGGSFDSEHPTVQAYLDRTRLEHTQRQLRELEGREVSLERLRENWQVESDKAGINRLRLNEQTRLLEQAGFAHVETVWRYLAVEPHAVAAHRRGGLPRGRALRAVHRTQERAQPVPLSQAGLCGAQAGAGQRRTDDRVPRKTEISTSR
jgi:trans-aconitate methyltransferase